MRLLLAPALVLMLLLPGASAAAAASGPVPLTANAQPARLVIKPHGFYRQLSVHNLMWSAWGSPTASARGTFTFQFCVEESCSVSPFYDQPVTVTLGAVKSCRGALYYTTLALLVEGPTPDTSFKGYRRSLGSCRPAHAPLRRVHA